jgi:hypothetical protein
VPVNGVSVVKRLVLVLLLVIVCTSVFADEKTMSPQEKAWCVDELKKIDSRYHQPKLINPDAKSICTIVQGILFPKGPKARCGNYRPIQTIPEAQRKPLEMDIFDIESAMIEAMQRSQPFLYPTMPLKPNACWMITYTRDPSKNPPTKLVIEQSYLH